MARLTPTSPRTGRRGTAGRGREQRVEGAGYQVCCGRRQQLAGVAGRICRNLRHSLDQLLVRGEREQYGQVDIVDIIDIRQ